jgi:hypothetical protein
MATDTTPPQRPLRAARQAPLRFVAWLGVALAADVALNPTHNHVPLCPLHAFTGLDCPFCGGLRAAVELTRGRFTQAAQDNLVFVALLPLIAAWWLDWILQARGARQRRALPRSAVIALTAVLVIFGVVRNLPFARALRP